MFGCGRGPVPVGRLAEGDKRTAGLTLGPPRQLASLPVGGGLRRRPLDWE